MEKKRYGLSLCLLVVVTVCLLLFLQHQYPATLSQLLSGRVQTAPSFVTVTSWPVNRENNFTIEDPAVLDQLWALIQDVPLAERHISPRFYPQKGCYRFSLDDGRAVFTDGVYLYTENRTYTAQTLPALLSILFRADETAQFHNAGGAFLPQGDDPLGWNINFHIEMAAFGLDGIGKFYAVTQREDGLWWCRTAPRYTSAEPLLESHSILLPRQLGDYRLTAVHSLSLSLGEELWHSSGVMALEGDFEPGQIYDWSDRLTVDAFSADYVGPAENPEQHKPNCPGLYVNFDELQRETWLPAPPDPYTEEPPFDGSELCAELTGWQVREYYSYAMGDQFEKGWTFTSPDGYLYARFARLLEVTDPTDIDWYRQALHRDMTLEELAEEGSWLLPLLDVGNAMK